MYLLILMIVITLANCDTKVWTYSIAIDDPVNWKDGKVQEDCNGLVMAAHNDLPVFINNLKIKQLVLPVYGTVRFEEGATIVFDEESKDTLNCVELNSTREKHWIEIGFWKNLDNPDNPAVPFSERPPCKYDDVVLPKGFNSSLAFLYESSPVNSVTFGEEKLSQNELNDLINNEVGDEVFPYWHMQEGRHFFKINPTECTDPTGCSRTAFLVVFGLPPRNLQCYNEIMIMGNQQERICGAQIVINTFSNGFTIDRIQKKLKEYKSYTHASKYDRHNQIQIIFTEKQFTGSSLIEATEFYNILRDDDSFFCQNVTLKISGPPLSEKNSQLKNAFSIVFGTLLGVLVIFGLLFLVYSPTVTRLNLRNRLLSTRPLSTYVLRYDNLEDRADIIDRQSLAGSVLTLNRSFENPMYEQAPSTPSTRSTSNETVIVPKLEEDQTKRKNTIDFDNAKELEDIDLLHEELNEKHDVLLKDL